ncbi:MAG: hypothetical protein AAFN10_27565 [Bacteroidota bacterium]
MNRIALILALFLPACSILSPENDEESLAPMGEYESSFPNIDWQQGDTLSLPNFQFGSSPEAVGYDSSQQIPAFAFNSIISQTLLEQASFDSSAQHFPMGALAFGEGKRAYMIGVYEDFHTFHTQLFLYDSLEERFTYTQSLAYLIGGGGFLSLRKAWMVDINQDQQPDLIYRKDELYNSPDPEHSYYLDTLRAEVWDGARFNTYNMGDISQIKDVFAMED